MGSRMHKKNGTGTHFEIFVQPTQQRAHYKIYLSCPQTPFININTVTVLLFEYFIMSADLNNIILASVLLLSINLNYE